MDADAHVHTLYAEVVEHLRGSCRSVHDAEQAFGLSGLDDSEAFCAALDAELFLCEGCGWWAEQGEGDGDNCEECCDDDAGEDF